MTNQSNKTTRNHDENMDKNVKTFVDWVSQMRDAQFEFFRTHDKRMLQRAKMLEAIVDNELNKMRNPSQLHPVQTDMFDDLDV